MKIIKNSLKAVSYAGILQFSMLIKLSFVIGSQMIWFSGVNAVVPLSGAFGGIIGSGLVFLLRQLLHLLFFKTFSLSFLAFCIPGLCASLYWASRHYSIRVLLPLVCMALFVIHPLGAQVFVYSFYWLIPVALYFINSQSLFLHALGSTFVAHAVGSVIWLYTVPMTVNKFMLLMPLVLFERIAFALGMVIAYHVFSFIFGVIDSIEYQKLNTSENTVN